MNPLPSEGYHVLPSPSITSQLQFLNPLRCQHISGNVHTTQLLVTRQNSWTCNNHNFQVKLVSFLFLSASAYSLLTILVSTEEAFTLSPVISFKPSEIIKDINLNDKTKQEIDEHYRKEYANTSQKSSFLVITPQLSDIVL